MTRCPICNSEAVEIDRGPATRWVRWRIKVKAHVLALICPFTACCGSLWVAVGALVASAPGVQAEEGQQRYTSRTSPALPSRAKREADVSLSHRCKAQCARREIPRRHDVCAARFWLSTPATV